MRCVGTYDSPAHDPCDEAGDGDGGVGVRFLGALIRLDGCFGRLVHAKVDARADCVA